MPWLTQQSRLVQVYCATLAALNDCGVQPDGAEIKPVWREELENIQPVDKEEVGVVLAGMLAEGVRFHGDRGSKEKFEAHPWFAGCSLGEV